MVTTLLTALRSTLFNILYICWTFFFAFITAPLRLFLKPIPLTRIVGRGWAHSTLFLLRVICGIRYRVEGTEHLPANGGYIFACKHQSAWETIAMHLVVPCPVYVLKQELIKLPLFGAHLLAMDNIVIDRSAGASALKSMVHDVNDRIAKGRPVVIFPEGTRTRIGANAEYQPGIAAIYSRCEAPVIPAALNAGKYWSRNAFMKYPGTIVLRILPPIQAGLRRDQFMDALYNSIEISSQALLDEKA